MALFGAILGGLLSYGAAKKQNKNMENATKVQEEALQLNKEEYQRQLEKEKEWYDTFGFIDDNIADFAKQFDSTLSAQYKNTQLEQSIQKAKDNTLKMLAQRGYDTGNGIEASLMTQIETQKQLRAAEIQATAPLEQAQTLMDMGQYAYSHKPNPMNALGNMTSQANQYATGLRSLGSYYGQRAASSAQFGGMLGGAIGNAMLSANPSWADSSFGRMMFGTTPVSQQYYSGQQTPQLF